MSVMLKREACNEVDVLYPNVVVQTSLLAEKLAELFLCRAFGFSDCL